MQNKMHVRYTVIYVVTYSVSSYGRLTKFGTTLSPREPATVTGLCNAASFRGSSLDSNCKINGDATGD